MKKIEEGKIDMEELVAEVASQRYLNIFDDFQNEYDREKEDDMQAEGDYMDADVEGEREMNENAGV